MAPFGLSPKEIETLRLLTRGHDAKSAAEALGVSVHTVNDRLRDARRKTQASSSRGAARLLAAQEHPEFLVPEQIAVPAADRRTEEVETHRPGASAGSRSMSRWGVTIMASAILMATILVGLAEPSASGARPQVVSTSPKADQIIAPGAFMLSVTFDRPMRRESYSFVRRRIETYPDCGANRPAQSADGRTFTMRCIAAPGRRYEIWFNDPPYLNFVGKSGASATPYRLRFRTR